jgi:hypothetical protein
MCEFVIIAVSILASIVNDNDDFHLARSPRLSFNFQKKFELKPENLKAEKGRMNVSQKEQARGPQEYVSR